MKIKTIILGSMLAIGMVVAGFLIVVKESTFTAIVTETGTTTILVEATGGVLQSGDFIVSIQTTTLLRDIEGNRIQLAEIEPGDTLTIVFFGGVLESDPGQIKKCYRVTLME